MNARRFLGVVFLCAAWPAAVFGNTYVKVADEWGTILTAGARPGPSGNRFWNVEGASSGFGDTGTLRFDTSDLLAKLNTDFGANNWKIDNVTLVLQHSDAAFSLPGNVNIFQVSNDTVAFTNGTDSNGGADLPPGNFGTLPPSTLVFDDAATSGGQKVRVKNSDGSPADLGTVTLASTFMFNSTGNTQTGKLDLISGASGAVNPAGAVNAGPDYTLAFPDVAGDTAAFTTPAATGAWSAGAIAAMSAHIQSGATALSFVLTSTDDNSTVAATYKGNPNAGVYAPRIYFSASALAAAGVPGDYNNNGVVDEADYVLWRNNLGSTTFTLPNRSPSSTGAISQTDYTFWRSRFGATTGSGSLVESAVPEPTSVTLVLLAIGGGLVGGRPLSRPRRALA